MPRRSKPRYGNKRYKPKKMKRPRGWHRRAKKPLWQIWRELQRDREKGVARTQIAACERELRRRERERRNAS